MPKVVIVGGGLSGLSVAFRLRQLAPMIVIDVLESRSRSGGNIGTETHDGFRIERGPNGFLDRSPALPQLCRELGLAERLIPASEGARKNRFLFLHGRLAKMPRGPLGLLTSSLLSLSGKWKLFTEPWRKRRLEPGDESIAAFVARRAGSEAASIFADALVTGIHGGDPTQLSVAAAFPRLPAMERDAGSIVRGFQRAAKQRRAEAQTRGEPPPGPMRMWSFRDGLQTLTDSLATTLGTAIHTDVRIANIRSANGEHPWVVNGIDGRSWFADAVVLSCPAYEQAALVNDFDPALANELAAIPYNRIAVVALGYRQIDCPQQPDGFGYIAPQNTRRDVLGVQWCSSIFPDRAPPGCVLWRALCGGVHRGEMVEWDDERLLRAVHMEMQLAMGVRGEPIFSRIIRWPRAIPQYVLGHLERLARIESLAARHAGLFLTGNAFRGIAMSDCAEQGALVAGQVVRFANAIGTRA